MCPGVGSASKNEYQEIPGGKNDRCVRVTFIVLKVEKIRSLNLPDPHGPVQACNGNTLPLPLLCITQ
jgi:hypothetical protein